MTRFITESLANIWPLFSQTLTKLEKASGHLSLDIRYTLEVKDRTKRKISELSLDPNDTTARELYHALQQKMYDDDKKLARNLQTIAALKVSAEADPIDGMVERLKELSDNKRCFALKLAKLKQLIKQNPPKKTMKLLGYRSIDSMLKREHPVLIIAAANQNESSLWQKKYSDQYKKLRVADFEERYILFIKLKNVREQSIFNADKTSNIISYSELGAIITLPLNKAAPQGFLTASLCTALLRLNDIRAVSSYLKLVQVRSNFGAIVAKLSREEPQIQIDHLDTKLPWSLIHRYYNKVTKVIENDLFDPYLRLEDMMWHPIEKSLAEIEPSLNFWQGTSHLGYRADNLKPVSMNVLDCAINLCNNLNFENQVRHYFSHNLWQSLMYKYVRRVPVNNLIKATETVQEESLVS